MRDRIAPPAFGTAPPLSYLRCQTWRTPSAANVMETPEAKRSSAADDESDRSVRPSAARTFVVLVVHPPLRAVAAVVGQSADQRPRSTITSGVSYMAPSVLHGLAILVGRGLWVHTCGPLDGPPLLRICLAHSGQGGFGGGGEDVGGGGGAMDSLTSQPIVRSVSSDRPRRWRLCRELPWSRG